MQERNDPEAEGAAAAGPRLATHFAEFVALTALLMALTALSIDIMLPSLPQIGDAFAIGQPNERQQVVTSYMLGLALGQLVWGPLSDRFGRKRLLIIGLFIFITGSLSCLVVATFPWLLAARAVQGFGGAAARVISVAIVRDLFVGRQMARVMSTVMMVFITVPIFAPTIGQALAHAGTWRWPFGVLLAVGVAGMIWAGFRLTETSSRRLPPSFATAVSLVLSSGVTVGYTIAWGLMFGCLVSYISSAQQVFVDVYGLGAAFPVAFGGVACAMALASFTNSRLVQRLGMRRVSHSALVLFVVVASTLSFAASVGQPPFALFGLLLALCFYCFGLIVPNFNAIAMQPMGAVAGTASSLIGFTTTVTGAGLGWAVGRLYDGTVRPLAFGFAALGLLALGCVLLVEGRRGLFRGE